MRLRPGSPPRATFLALIVALFATATATAAAASDSTDVIVPSSSGVDRTSLDKANNAATSRGERDAGEHRTEPSTASLALDISPHTIRKAIADSREPEDDVRSSGSVAFGTGNAPAVRIDRAFRDAEIPSCINGSALRFEPTTIGPIALGGYLLLPLWIHAIATGRCR